jgi:hypothetical protein
MQRRNETPDGNGKPGRSGKFREMQNIFSAGANESGAVSSRTDKTGQHALNLMPSIWAAREALSRRIVVEIGAEPTLNFLERHTLPHSVVGGLVAADLAHMKIT